MFCEFLIFYQVVLRVASYSRDWIKYNAIG